MTCHTKHCAQLRQPCPSQWACTTGCKSNVVEIRRESLQDKASATFWAPDLPVQFVGPETDEAIQPDAVDRLIGWAQRRAWHIAIVCGLVAAGIYVAGSV